MTHGRESVSLMVINANVMDMSAFSSSSARVYCLICGAARSPQVAILEICNK